MVILTVTTGMDITSMEVIADGKCPIRAPTPPVTPSKVNKQGLHCQPLGNRNPILPLWIIISLMVVTNLSAGKLSLNKPLIFWVRIVLGLIFAFAGLDKLLHPEAFAKIIYNYQILPDAFIGAAAVILPWLELLLGGMLITGLWMHGASLLANMLLILFWTTLVFNMARGLDVHCGCFSTNTSGRPPMGWYLVRDSIFLALGAFLFYSTFIKPRVHSGNTGSQLSKQ